MARYTDDSRDRVRDAVDMVDLVGSRVELRRAGVNRFEGLCPFHDERTPSFGINPAEKLYYCFGCGEGGDAFKFVQETEGVGFAGALEYLADRYGVALELVEEDPAAAQRRAERERLLELLERTAAFYVRYLWDSEEAAHAREYLAGRGLDEGALREFRVGYAPSAWDKVLVASRRTGFSDRELVAAGLASRSQKEGRTYDRFRRRIMFPLCDQRGRVLGFGARAMGADQKPKYLNSSDGLVFHKGRHLFGADIARAPAAKAGAVDRRRGLHRRHRDAPGRAAPHGRAHGHRADRRAGRRARAPGADGAAGARRRRRRAGGDAARRARRGAAQPDAARRAAAGRAAIPADLVAAEGARAMADRVDASVPFVRFRVERELAGARPRRAPRARTRSSRRCARSSRSSRPARCARSSIGLVADRTELAPALVASWLAQGAGARRQAGARDGNGAPQRRPALPQPALDAAGRAERNFLAQCQASGPAGSTRSARWISRRRSRRSRRWTRRGAPSARSWRSASRRPRPGARRWPRWTSRPSSRATSRAARPRTCWRSSPAAAALPEDDDELATLIAALTVLAGGMRTPRRRSRASA